MQFRHRQPLTTIIEAAPASSPGTQKLVHLPSRHAGRGEGLPTPPGLDHGSAVLEQFQAGERRLLFARHREDGALYYLEDGEARGIREFARANLICPVPGCLHPALTTVSRAGKRDGFRHLVGGSGHGPESVDHVQGKALLARWAALQHPDAEVSVEQTTATRTRRADVMVTWPDGRRIALEIQCSALSAHEWSARHESYTQQGIIDVWFFGSRSCHLRRADHPENGGREAVALSTLHRTMVAAGEPVLWLDTSHEMVGTPWVDAASFRCANGGCTHASGQGVQRVPPRAEDRIGRFTASSLGSYRLEPDGLAGQTLQELQDEIIGWRARREADHARRAADREREDAEYRRRHRREREQGEERRQSARLESSTIRCRACGGKLDPCLAETGLHILCQ